VSDDLNEKDWENTRFLSVIRYFILLLFNKTKSRVFLFNKKERVFHVVNAVISWVTLQKFNETYVFNIFDIYNYLSQNLK